MSISDNRSDWWAQAACQSADPELFFPISELAASDRNIAAAKAICGRCHVRDQCLAHAMGGEPLQGIWGGTTEKERRLMRSRGRRQATAAQ